MSQIRLYFDDDSAERALIAALRDAGVDAATPEESGNRGAPDELHLAFAAGAGRAIVTANQGDFVRLHSAWVGMGRAHSGVIISNQKLGIGERTRRLLRLADALSAEDCVNRLEFLTNWGE